MGKQVSATILDKLDNVLISFAPSNKKRIAKLESDIKTLTEDNETLKKEKEVLEEKIKALEAKADKDKELACK